MGYSTIIGHVILFSLVLVGIGFLIEEVNDYLIDTTKDVEYQQETLKDQIDTRIELTTVTYSATDYYIYVNNTGKTILETDCMDLYIDREFIPTTNYSITIQQTIFDPTLWNPDETLEIDAWWDLTAGTHEIKVGTCNAMTDSRLITVS